MKLKKLLLVLAVIIAGVSCNKYLTKDSTAANHLESAHNLATDLYKFMAQGNRSYQTYETMYQEISTALDNLYVRDQQRNTAGALQVQDRVLIKGWATLTGYHRGRKTLSVPEVEQERKTMQALFEPRLRSEAAIK